MSDPCLEPAHRLAEQLRSGAVSSLDLLERHVERLNRLNPALNAVVATNLDAARERARSADAARGRGESWGPLHGLPMTIKDTLEVTGMPTAAGSPSLMNHQPKRNAAAVQRLVDAGAVVFGKTNVPLFGGDVQTYNEVYGTTNNPWNVAHTPGGSSGGAAAALAAGLTPLELGSDIGGSIRTPAHFCGVYGHKPSRGIVPLRGHVPPPPGTLGEGDLVVVGPLARSAEDLALALKVVAGPSEDNAAAWRLELPAPKRAQLRDYRVRAWIDDPFCPLDAGVKAALEAAVEALRQAGASVETGAPAGFSLEEVYELYFDLLCAVFAGGLPEKIYQQAARAGTLGALFGKDRVNTLLGFSRRATRSHRDWLHRNERRERVREKCRQLFAEIDILLTPVALTAAPPHNSKGSLYDRRIAVNGATRSYGEQFVWISPATLAGLPATVAPVGRTPDGLPVGIQAVGGHLQDLTTIDFARLLTEKIGGYAPPPQK